ncbi:MAG: 50S ribosomal protein L11 methyltransferase [Gammaproteobacteria bacterium]
MSDAGDWLELRIAVARTEWPALEALLDELGAAAVTQAAGDRALFDEPGVAPGAAWERFTVEALFAGDSDATLLIGQLRAALGSGLDVSARRIADTAWEEAWKAHWQPLVFAGGICVCPSWLAPPAAVTHLIRLDPGQAFGTGTHETTALAIDWLAAQAPLAGQRVIDYGTGSGVLALAAAALGAATVHGVDIDAAAVSAAQANVRDNARADVVTIAHVDALALAPADVLVANILLEPLCALAPRFAALVRPGGRLALTGLLADQAAAISAAYAGAFTLAAPRARGDWILVAGERRAA